MAPQCVRLLLLLVVVVCLAVSVIAQENVRVVTCVARSYNYSHLTYVQPQSAIAHRLLDGKCGIEIGAGACNPFGLTTINVGLPFDADPVDYENHRNGQLTYCGDVAPIDVTGDVASLPIHDSALNFVLSAHVWEHAPNPLAALEEWVRVTMDEGIVFAIVPNRNALPSDVGRPVTTLQQLIHYREIQATTEDFPGVEYRGHYIVFSTDLLLQIMMWFNAFYYSRGMSLSLLAFLEVDDKAGNGHLVAWRVNKAESRPSEEIPMISF